MPKNLSFLPPIRFNIYQKNLKSNKKDKIIRKKTRLSFIASLLIALVYMLKIFTRYLAI